MGIDAHALAAHAAEQVHHRHAELLAQDIPERHLNAGHRSGTDDARHAVAHHAQQHLLPEKLDARWILAEEDRPEILDRRLDDARPAAGLAQAGDAFIGLDLHEEPVAPTTTPPAGRCRIHEKGFDVGNSHGLLSLRIWSAHLEWKVVAGLSRRLRSALDLAR